MNTQLNILIINQYASTPEYSSGAGERFFYLLPYFSKEGINASVLSGSYNHLFLKQPPSEQLFNHEMVSGGKIIWVKLRKYRGENFLGRLFSWFEFLFKLFIYPIGKNSAPNIILVSSMSIFPILYALKLRKQYGAKIILEVRDIWPLTPLELGNYSRKHPFIALLSYLEKLAYKKSDVVVSVLPGFKMHVANVLGHERKVFWIPNGINVSEKTLSNKKEKQTSDFVIMYTGALGIANAMEFVLEAAKILKNIPEIQFHIIGEGPKKPQLIDYVANESLSNVLFIDKIPKSDVINHLQKADLCIISWRNKNIYKYGVSANKYNDYMLASKPILSASNIDDDPVMIANCGIQVASESPEAIAEGILKIKNLPEEARRVLGENGRKYVIENQTYEKIAEKYIACIKSLDN